MRTGSDQPGPVCSQTGSTNGSSALREPFRQWKGTPMDLGIQGLRVLVTAGASGIGLEIARSFVREGARVHLCDVDEAALDSVAARPGRDPIPC